MDQGSVGPQWVVRYVSALVVLLLTGPLTIAFFSLVVNGLATVHTIWDPGSWPYLVGLVMIAFAPFAVFGLFTFVGAVAADAIGSRLGGHAVAIGSRGVRTAASIPSRLGSLPAGAPKPGKMPASKPSAGQRGPAGPSGRVGGQTKTQPPAANSTARVSTVSPKQTSTTPPSPTPSKGTRR